MTQSSVSPSQAISRFLSHDRLEKLQEGRKAGQPLADLFELKPPKTRSGCLGWLVSKFETVSMWLENRSRIENRRQILVGMKELLRLKENSGALATEVFGSRSVEQLAADSTVRLGALAAKLGAGLDALNEARARRAEEALDALLGARAQAIGAEPTARGTTGPPNSDPATRKRARHERIEASPWGRAQRDPAAPRLSPLAGMPWATHAAAPVPAKHLVLSFEAMLQRDAELAVRAGLPRGVMSREQQERLMRDFADPHRPGKQAGSADSVDALRQFAVQQAALPTLELQTCTAMRPQIEALVDHALRQAGTWWAGYRDADRLITNLKQEIDGELAKASALAGEHGLASIDQIDQRVRSIVERHRPAHAHR